MTNRIQFRRGVAADWALANPVLGLGEAGVETDTTLLKIGNGVNTWAQLPYIELDSTRFQAALRISPLPPLVTPPGTVWIACAAGGSFSPTPPIQVPFTGTVSFTGSGTLTAGSP